MEGVGVVLREGERGQEQRNGRQFGEGVTFLKLNLLG